jgi:hypothetical protein
MEHRDTPDIEEAKRLFSTLMNVQRNNFLLEVEQLGEKLSINRPGVVSPSVVLETTHSSLSSSSGEN